MAKVLGISAFFHDSAAALVCDGAIVAAAQEERFTRIKHDAAFPARALEYCLAEGRLKASELDAVVFYEKPLLKFERLMSSYLAVAPGGFASFMKALPQWLHQKLFLPREISRGLGGGYNGPLLFCGHHEAHAASAFYPSPFESAAVLTLDGVGEWSTVTWGLGQGNQLDLKQEIRFPHSLGLLYSAFTYYCGFRVNSGEYKLMGLAPYGRPLYSDLILEKIVHLRPDGSFWLDQAYFNYIGGLSMCSPAFDALFGGPARKPGEPLLQRHMDLAASIQRVTEEVVLAMAREVHQKTGEENLCLAGGVALNCVANGRLLREGPFKRLWIQPAAGDAGGALGAALLLSHKVLGLPRPQGDRQKGSYLGPGIDSAQAKSELEALGAKARTFDTEEALFDQVATLLEQGKVLGCVQGRMEFGPRALGHRSILGDPRNRAMQTTMNVKIKFRESFRPFAPSVLAERAGEYFELGQESPYMLLVAPVQASRRMAPSPEEAELFGIDRLKSLRSDIPSVTHVDYSARVQTVDKSTSPRYWRLIKAFEARSGYGVVVNTSFNIRGEPIVNTPAEAYRCFMLTDMDALLVEDLLFLKEEQPPMAGAEEYRKGFLPD